MKRFLDSVREVLGDTHVLTDADRTAGYSVDWTQRFVGHTPAVVRPGGVEEVAELVDLAREHRVALVPQGGNTGLVGGGVPLSGEVVVSLQRLHDLEPVDRAAGQVTAGAGVTLADLEEHARSSGWAFGVDLASRESATIGGMVATNAGGIHVLRHGAMRAQLLGVEAVLGTGETVARMSGLVKDNTGYDLAQLLCGSEGTLGIVTRVRLRLVPPAAQTVVALVGLSSIADAVETSAQLRLTMPGLQALEVMSAESMRLVAEHRGQPLPVAPGAGAFLLVEVAGAEDPTEALASALADVEDAAVAITEADRQRLWAWREAHPEVASVLARKRDGVIHKLDVTLPASELAGFCDKVTARVRAAWPDSLILLYGHVGDGNIHVNVVAPPEAGEAVDDTVLALVVELGGSISAEHGIGTAKKAWLPRDRSSAEVTAMRAIKDALDPDHILNPNVLLPAP